MNKRGSISNQYTACVNGYDIIPKAVFAAVAVSFATCGGDHLDNATELIVKEWEKLWKIGIISQKPTHWALKCGGVK